MEINNWSNKEIIKLLTARAGITQKELYKRIGKKLGVDYTTTGFSSKLKRNSLKVAELQAICEVLGYNFLLEKKEK